MHRDTFTNLYLIYSEVDDDKLLEAWDELIGMTDSDSDPHYRMKRELFLELDGLDLFINCMDKFSDNETLVQHMVICVSNIAESESLWPKLLKRDFVLQIAKFADSNEFTDGNWCGLDILAMLISDGPKSWQKTKVQFFYKLDWFTCLGF